MLTKYFGSKIHTHIHLFGLFVLATSLPWSKALMSICILLLSLNFLLEADFKESWQRLKSNKLYVGFLIWYVFLWIGLFWSKDLQFGIHDVKVKASIFAFTTTILSRPPLSKKQLHFILISFLSAMFITSFSNFGQYNYWWGNNLYEEIRGMSLYSNHIRYALLISMSVAVSIYFFQKEKKYRVLFTLLAVWFAFYTIYSQVLTGYITLIGVLTTTAVYFLYQKSKWLFAIFSFLFLAVLFLGGKWIFTPLKINKYHLQNLQQKTALGNPYTHNFALISSFTHEPILMNVCREEVKETWEKRSQLNFHASTPKGDELEALIYRYLTAKGLKKDAHGVNQLTDNDIQRIEQGITFPKEYTLTAPFHNLRFQLNNTSSPNGHSLLQRIEYWRTSIEIIKENWLFGVGTGDNAIAFHQKYKETNSPLLPEFRHRSHNQFFAIWISIGVFGVLVFLWIHIEFIRFQLKNRQLLGLSFIAIFLASYFFEDSLETQRVVSFFGLFFGLLARKD